MGFIHKKIKVFFLGWLSIINNVHMTTLSWLSIINNVHMTWQSVSRRCLVFPLPIHQEEDATIIYDMFGLRKMKEK